MSGSTIGGIAGGVIGAYFGTPQLGFAVGSMIGGALDPQHIDGPRLGDIPVQTAQEGAPRPIVYGSPQPFPGNIILSGPKIHFLVKDKQDKGGPTSDHEEVEQTYAIRICEGPAYVITVWRDGKVVFDRSGQFALEADSAAFASKAVFYTGDESQLPDAVLEGLPAENGGGVGNVNAYRGTAYMRLERDNLTGTGGRIPNYEFRMASSATITTIYGPPQVIASTNNGLGSAGQTGVSQTGTTWDQPINSTIADYYAYGNGVLLRFLSNNSYASEDRGDTWEAAVALGGTPAGRPYFNGQFYVPGPGSGVVKSAAGASWSTVAGTSVGAGTAIGGTGSLIVVGSNTGHASFSDDSGATFSAPSVLVTSPPPFTSGPPITAISDGGPVVVLGDGDGHLWWTEDGVIYTECTGSPFTNDIVRIHYNEAAGVYVALELNGKTAYSSSGTGWAESTTTGMHGADVDSLRGLFIMAANPSAGVRKIYTSTNGSEWTERANVFTLYPFAAIAAMPCAGLEAPDAPGFYVGYDGTFCGGTAELATIDTAILADIELDLASRCGVRADQFDVSADTAVEVEGFLVTRQMQGKSALQTLGMAFFRDYPEHDLQIHSVPRGRPSVVTLTDDDFLISTEDEEGRRQAIELPRKLNLFFSDPAANYARVPVPAERESTNIPSTGVVSVELPLVFNRDVAAQKADIMLKALWEEAQGDLKRELPAYEFAYLVASDCFDFDSKRWRIDKADTIDGVLKIEAKRDRISNWASAATANGVLDPTAPVSNIKGPTVLKVMNLPSLRASDNQAGVYAAATGLLSAWPGAHLYLSVDGGASEQLVGTISQRATIGEVVSITEDSNGDFDPLVVTLYDNRELESITADQLAARENAFAVITDDVAEIGQFQTATEDSNGDWELTDTSRGQLSTEESVHEAGSTFVLLDGAVYFIPIDPQHAGKTLIFRAVTRGTAPENNPTVSLVFDPPTFVRHGGVVTS